MNNYHFAAFTYGFITAWIICGIEVVNITPRRRRKPQDQDPDWRRSFNHENMNKPSEPPPFRLQRSGYRSINYPDPSPDRRPTNPFNGERIPNPPPRNP